MLGSQLCGRMVFPTSLEVVGGVLGLPLPGLDAVFTHGQRAVDPVQLVVEAAGVADGLALVVATPEGGGSSPAVGATQAVTP